jgi:hypothetical protein
MKTVFAPLAVLATVLALTACGNTPGDRALSGGAIGAGGGAVAGAMLGSPVHGAILGGAVGAGVGALTDTNEIDLGKPFWK